MFTKAERIQLLEGEIAAAKALADLFRVALDKKIVTREDVQHDLSNAVDSWFALHEQRTIAETKDNPSHIFN